MPRYRQRLAEVPGGLANPVWVDDEHFDLDYHVRRSALPRPGTDEQLRELVVADRVAAASTAAGRCGRSTSSRASRATGSRCSTRPTRRWSTASHTVDLGQLLLDMSPEPKALDPDDWAPRPAPSTARPGRRRGRRLA